MTDGSKLFRIDPSTRDATSLREVDFAQLGLKERSDIQEWAAAHQGTMFIQVSSLRCCPNHFQLSEFLEQLGERP